MQGVDMVIAGVGVVAVVATVLGVVFYDQAAGIDEISFEEQRLDGALTGSLSDVAAGSGANEINVALPDNATAARGTVSFDFTGQTGQGDDVTFDVWFVGPNGTIGDKESTTLTLGANEDSGSAEVDLPKFSWAEIPQAVNTTDRSAVDETIAWADDLQVMVEISRAGNDNLVGVLPDVSYTFDVEVSGDLFAYRMAPRDIPDPQAGQ